MRTLWFDGFENYGLLNEVTTQGVWSQFETGGQSGLVEDNVCTGQYAYRSRSGRGAIRRPANPDGPDPVAINVGMHLFCSRLPSVATNVLPGNTGNSQTIVQFRGKDGLCDISIVLAYSGKLVVLRGGYMDRFVLGWPSPYGGAEVLGTSQRAIAAGTHNHIEVCMVSAAEGQVVVRVNGREFINLEDVNTLRDGQLGPGITEVCHGNFVLPNAEYGDWVWDNIFCRVNDDIEDDTLPSFLGQYEVFYLPPVADLNPMEWELTSGVIAWPLVNDIAPDDDANYMFASSLDMEAHLEVEELPLYVSDVEAVMVVSRARSNNSGGVYVELGLAKSNIDLRGDTSALTMGYTYNWRVFGAPPDAEWFNPLDLPAISVIRVSNEE